MEVQVQAARRNTHMLSAREGRGSVEHLKWKNTEDIHKFRSKQNRDEAASAPNQLILYATVCLLGAKLCLLFKSLGRKRQRIQIFLDTQTKKGRIFMDKRERQ